MAVFTIDAYIVAARNRHHRTHDHTGFETDTNVVISQPIGPYPSGTTLAVVLAGMHARLADIELLQYADRVFDSFTIDAIVGPHFRVDAVILKTQSASFTIDAYRTKGGRFTIDAIVQGGATFTIDAVIV